MSLAAITAPTSTKLSNWPVKIDESPQSFGRGLISTESVPGGSLLLSLDPLISVLDDNVLEIACSACFVPSKTVDELIGHELLRCTGCKRARYCSKVTPQRAMLTYV